MIGRAKSAPQTRTSTGNRTTIAEANAVSQEEPDPVMPHKSTPANRLDAEYPSLEVPAENDHDYHDDQRDGLLREGTKVAEKIIEDAKKYGRRRRVGAEAC